MLSKFFIRRPIVAMVIAILTVIVGIIVVAGLPVSLFPAIIPPETKLSAFFTGADAQTLAQSVATPIAEKMSGVDNMNYMYSVNANANGQMTMIVDFGVKTDPDTDLILSQMRESQAASQLPAAVNEQGVLVQKSTHAPMMLVSIYSPNGSHNSQFLANYAFINMVDPISRVPGVANVQVFGAGQYAMRVWLNPDALAKLGLTVSDVIQAVQAQNTVNPGGQLGAQPAPRGQQFTYAVRAQGRLATPEQFGNIVVRENPKGGVVRLKDVAQIELGTQTYTQAAQLNGKPSAILAVYQLPGSNAIDTANGVNALLKTLEASFPPGVAAVPSLDTTQAVREGLQEILFTLAIALLLVILVVYLFLQSWRATLIPLLAVPVSLIGTFIIFPALGFSINTLSMFGMVLAIGLVVDDAIVVVEAVEHHMSQGMKAKAAALRSMEELSGPVVGIALVLSAVLIPTAFVPGITGRLYQQFAATIAISVILSAFNALSLSPALAALLLKPRGQRHRGPLGVFFRWFNRTFEKTTHFYVRGCHVLAHKTMLAFVLLLGFAVLGIWFGSRLPSGFLPDEDQGYVFVNLQLPPAASLERTEAAVDQINKILLSTPGVRYVNSVAGFSLLSYVETSYNGFFFVVFKPWGARTRPDEQYKVIEHRLNAALGQLPAGAAFSFSPPEIPGVGTSGGVTMVLEDRAGKGVDYLARETDTFLAAARQRPEIARINTSFLPHVPQRFIHVDRAQALKQGVAIHDIYETLQADLGGVFVNYFNRFGRQWQVYVESGGQYRTNPADLSQFYVRNNHGGMVPLSAVASFEPGFGPEFVMHFNEYNSAQINATAAPGVSSEQAMAALEQVFHQTMPHDMGFNYMGMSFQEKKAMEGIPASVIFGFSVLFVFLLLAALYESWSLPLSVLICLPVAVFGAFFVLWLRRVVMLHLAPAYSVQLENDVYAQIGLVMLIGLAAKNAILIVEFARTEYAAGRDLIESALAAAHLRLRPILMTTFAFIFGCAPLWFASGSGAVARRIMGTVVIGGAAAAAAFAVFLIPAMFVLIEQLLGGERKRAHTALPAPAPATPQEVV
ncbi:MAG: efflux RND transporter permease subunit [Acidobacteria bacterium]|nr:MAG: efflux RND transporter permease subunit [Acidobacteriota bacterium]